MKILIKENQLFNMFSNFMEIKFGKLYYDPKYDEIYYYDIKKNKIPFGYLYKVFDEKTERFLGFEFYFWIVGADYMISTMEGLFGKSWRELMLKYIQELLPSHPILFVEQ